MWPVEYYTDRRNKQPVAIWLDEITRSDAAGASTIDAQIQKLREYGLSLIGTNMMKRISGTNNHLYELLPGSYRVIVYYDVMQSKFIILHAFRKKKQRQKRDIEYARRILSKYLSIAYKK